MHVDTIHGHWQIDAAMEDLWNMMWMASCYTEARITHLLGGSANSRHDPGRGQRSLRGREEGRRKGGRDNMENTVKSIPSHYEVDACTHSEEGTKWEGCRLGGICVMPYSLRGGSE